MRRIHVIRHAQPVVHYPPPAAWIEAGHLNDLLDRYDASTIVPFEKRAALTGKLLASDLPRARDTASMLFGISPAHIETHSMFREVPLPRFENKARRLPAGALLAISRVGWYTGTMPCEEPRRASIQRAARAADFLCEELERADTINLVSHGFFLLLLGRELNRRGFRTGKRGLYRHLESATFQAE